MYFLSKRLELIKPSPTLAVTKKAAELKRQGKDIISLGAGEPDFDTPDNIKLAAIEGIRNGQTKYTNVDGTVELKSAIIAKLKRENNLDYNLNEIIVGTGGKQVIYNLFMASLNLGDEVIIPAPYWVSYPDIVILSGGTPVTIKCEIDSSFKMTPSQLRQAITPKTKWLILNSPSNPSGATYTLSELQELAKVLNDYPQILIMSDDIYEHIIYDDMKFYDIAQISDQMKERTFIVNGVSKAYSMTGWRIGYGAGLPELIAGMTMLQSQSTSNPSSISQVAAVEALNGIQDYIPVNSGNFQIKRDLALSILTQTSNLECHKPEGAFYLFVKCSKLFGKKYNNQILNDSNDVTKFLLEAAEVAVVPGIAFGLEGYFRISYATALDNIATGCQRIVDACNTI